MSIKEVKGSWFVAAIGLVALIPSTVAKADAINGSGSWQSDWTQAQLVDSTSPTPGMPYWNNSSGDGPKGNIGWCLTGGSATCTMLGSPGWAPYYGSGVNGGAVSNMFFTSSGNPLLLTLAGIHTNETIAATYDIFGYYLVPTSGSPTLIPLFSTNPGGSSSTVGSTATISLAAGTDYGFYIENIRGGGGPFQTNYTFFMNSAWNSVVLPNGGTPMYGPDSLQHFAIFQASNGYVIGDVDGDNCSGNPVCLAANEFDYNDLIVTDTSTPEPATVGLFGISLVLVAALKLRKLKQSA